tara:strand:- start:1600 stop:2634 length:1035 start_codon:yes stop_codon:yes gene_type:complete
MNKLFDHNLLIILAALFIINIIFLYFFSIFGKNIKLVDIPNERKTHIGEIPLVGGISIYSTFILFFLIVETNNSHKIIFLSSFIVFFISLYDDKFGLGITERLFFQIISCLVILGFGIRIFDIGEYMNITISLGGFGIVLTCLTIIGYMNAINFSDGLDGLASGYVLNCLISIIIFSFMNSNYDNLEPLIFLIIVLIGFMISNHGLFIPKTFLGDCGSASMGFLISCYLIYFTMPDNRYFHPVLVLWAAPMPTFDFLTVFSKRIIEGSNPFKPDRRHIHYLLISSNYPNKLIPITLVIASLLCSICGFLIYEFLGSIHSLILFLFIFCIYFLLSISISSIIKKN